MTTQPREVGGITATFDERKRLAKSSRYFYCAKCGVMHQHLLATDGALHNAAVAGHFENMKTSTPKSKSASRRKLQIKKLSSRSLLDALLRMKTTRIFIGAILIATVFQAIFASRRIL